MARADPHRDRGDGTRLANHRSECRARVRDLSDCQRRFDDHRRSIHLVVLRSGWGVRVAALFATILLVPAYFLAVFIERWVAYLFVRTWSWRSNLYAYEGMLALLLVVAVYDEFFRR